MFTAKQSLIEADESRVFEDMVQDDGLLESFYNEQISASELLARLEYFKVNAPNRARREREDSFQRSESA